MNKTAIKVLQEMVRNKEFTVEGAVRRLGKAKTTIYDCLASLRKQNILDVENHLQDNQLTQAYKRLFLAYPYDFSFLTTNNLKILFFLDCERSFGDIVRQTGLSRYTVHRLLKELRRRGFVTKKNKLIQPQELITVIVVIKKFQQTVQLRLPATAVIVDDNEQRSLIRTTKGTTLPLKPTAFSAFTIKIVLPHRYYTTKKRVTVQDIFDDAKIISYTRREKLLTALFYKKNRRKLQKDQEYEELICSEEFREMSSSYG